MQADTRLQGVPCAKDAQKEEGGHEDGEALRPVHAHEFPLQEKGKDDEHKEEAGEQGTAGGEHGPRDDACREGDRQRFYASRLYHTCKNTKYILYICKDIPNNI